MPQPVNHWPAMALVVAIVPPMQLAATTAAFQAAMGSLRRFYWPDVPKCQQADLAIGLLGQSYFFIVLQLPEVFSTQAETAELGSAVHIDKRSAIGSEDHARCVGTKASCVEVAWSQCHVVNSQAVIRCAEGP